MAKSNDKDPVELSDYIDTALRAIVRGVHKAQISEDVRETKAVINPANLNWSEKKKAFHPVSDKKDTDPRVEIIEFEIMVTHEESKGHVTGGEGGVQIKVIQSMIDTHWRKDRSDISTNRLKFSIPVLLPQDYYSFPED